jgi:hypothetical protein
MRFKEFAVEQTTTGMTGTTPPSGSTGMTPTSPTTSTAPKTGTAPTDPKAAQAQKQLELIGKQGMSQRLIKDPNQGGDLVATVTAAQAGTDVTKLTPNQQVIARELLKNPQASQQISQLVKQMPKS